MKITSLKPLPPRYCVVCGTRLYRKVYSDGVEGPSDYGKRMTCDRTCAAARKKPRTNTKGGDGNAQQA